jgi:hypothetical protein
MLDGLKGKRRRKIKISKRKTLFVFIRPHSFKKCDRPPDTNSFIPQMGKGNKR